MPPISTAWPDVDASLAVLEPEYADRITSMVAFVTPRSKVIETYASSLHPTKCPCRIITDHYTWGQSFAVFEILFDDDVSWIMRFGMRPMDAYFNTAEQLERKILNEVAALQLVRERTTIPVPRVLAFHAHPSPCNPLGPHFPAFVLMTAMAGATIEERGISTSGSGDPLRGDESKRPILLRYLRDIADIHVQLSRITFDRIGSFMLEDDGRVSVGPGADYGLGPFASAREYFRIQADAYERLAEVDVDVDVAGGGGGGGGNNNNTDPTAARLKRQFVASLWRAAIMPLLDDRDDRGPFPMRHGDLHNDNILVDVEGHIVGVLDWDCAGTVPWEAFAVPTFEVSGDFVDLGYGSRDERLAVHDAFNAALREAQDAPVPPSGRTLAELHNSNAGHVAAYLAYWMFSMACDYDHTGRALHTIMGLPDDMDLAFQKFVDAHSRGSEGIPAVVSLPSISVH
ncbi:putative phosphotransferase enzyme family protein [Lyophyllum shimeji]|uniref:Phosphotransferase enzyme family protein n=1 Tax=Lyophyllum shimeji TaxID=47721 RepID=A0A9P3UTI1_LYOSH|nr:putative phosphotransferase enzyme family protein [Lyophyllum shimeji]